MKECLYTSSNHKGKFITNVENICNLIGRERYNISHIVFLVSILYPSTKNNKIQFLWREKYENY